MAKELIRKAKVKIPHGGCGILELRNFQEYLIQKGIALVVFTFSGFGCGRESLFDGTQQFIHTNSVLRHTSICYIMSVNTIMQRF